MKTILKTGVAALALFATTAGAAELKFKPGEDSRLNWGSYEEFKKAHGDLKGQTLTIFGPWRGDDEALRGRNAADAGVGEDFEHGAGVAQGAVDDRAAGAVPAAADKCGAAAVPQGMALVADAEYLHQAAIP
mgnify:CR=1 FL=1